MAKVISVLSQKGGSGKTNLVENLAVAAALSGKKVLLFDLDQQKSLTDWHRDRPTNDIELPDADWRELVKLDKGQVSTLPYDFIFIDTPPAHDTLVALDAAAKFADLVIVTVRPSARDLRAIRHTLELLKLRGGRFRFLLSQVPAVGSGVQSSVDALSEHAEMFETRLHFRQDFSSANIVGKGVMEAFPNSKAAAEVAALWSEIQHLV
jgi:chromosome partitioning protein